MSRTKKLRLEDTFQIFTVVELKELCRTVGIRGISSKKKADLIRVLIQSLMDVSTFCQFCFYATPKEIKAFERGFSHPLIEEEEYEDYLYWLQTGYCFMEENGRILIMEEVKDLYQRLGDEFWEKRNRFYQILQYIYAAIHLYGVVTLQKLVELFNQRNEQKTSVMEIRNVFRQLEERPELMEFDIQDDLIMDEILLDVDQGYYVYEAVYEQQGDLPYYIPGKDEFLKYADEDYFEKTKEYECLLDYLVQVYGIPKIIAEDICADSLHSIRLGYLVEDIVEDFIERGIEMDKFHRDDLMILVLQLMNHTRSIFYRGATPKEIGAAIEYSHLKKHSRKFVYQDNYANRTEAGKVISFPGNFR